MGRRQEGGNSTPTFILPTDSNGVRDSGGHHTGDRASGSNTAIHSPHSIPSLMHRLPKEVWMDGAPLQSPLTLPESIWLGCGSKHDTRKERRDETPPIFTGEAAISEPLLAMYGRSQNTPQPWWMH